MSRKLSLALIPLTIIAALGMAGCGGSSLVLAPERTDITATQLQDMMGDGKPLQIVDVRSAAEYANGFIPGAVNIPVDDIKGPAEELAALNANIRTVVYCRTGSRSLNASQALLDLGFTQVFNLVDGIESWPGALHTPGCGCS